MLLVKVLGMVLCAFLLLLNLTSRASVSMDQYEAVSVSGQNGAFYLLFLLGLLTLFFGGQWLEKISEKRLLRVFTWLYMAAGVFLILNADPRLRSDSRYVWEAARAFRAGDYSALDVGEYLFVYPHQLGLVTYELFLGIFAEHTKLLYMANLALVLVNNYALYRIADIWFGGNPTVNKYTILLSHLFLPQLFLILFAYGNIPGTACMTLALWWGSRFLLDRNWKSCGITVLFASLAILLRNNNMIPVIALAAVFFLAFLKRPGARVLVMTLALLLSLVLPQRLLYSGYEAVTDRQIPEGMPKILWVAMGMQEGERCAGWHNSFNSMTYRNADYNTNLAGFIGEQEVQRRLETFCRDPAYGADFYHRKLVSTWCEPTYQSLWSGPLPECGQMVGTAFLQDLYSGGRFYQTVELFCGVLVGAVLLLSLGYLVMTGRTAALFPLFSVICLIGGFLFHLLWETKSQYVSGYIYYLIPLAAGAVALLQSRLALQQPEKE